ncbi:MAG: hypothetical protein OEU92_20630, partial [Alphaproteobacteria bacterium]|nr:hypothetical protein [Alphaproteobacteria bacterium]
THIRQHAGRDEYRKQEERKAKDEIKNLTGLRSKKRAEKKGDRLKTRMEAAEAEKFASSWQSNPGWADRLDNSNGERKEIMSCLGL